MERKNNIRSMRFSDRTIELIEQQAGENFTQKFEALVTRCVWELPEAERRLEYINMQIKETRETLGRMSNRANGYRKHLAELERNIQQLSNTIAKAQELYWESTL